MCIKYIYDSSKPDTKSIYINGNFVASFTREVDTEKEELNLSSSEKVVFSYPEDAKNNEYPLFEIL